MIALARNGLLDLDLYCEVDGRVVRSHLKPIGGPEVCKWGTYLIDCPADVSRPNQIALLKDAENKHEVRIK
jgi:hypothetical protein